MRGLCPLLAAITLAMSSSLLFGCTSNDNGSAPVCIDAGIDPNCTPAYEPTYDALFANTFQSSCATSGVSCHASTGHQAGIDFGDREGSYVALTRDYLRAGKPECSALVHRVVATDGKVRMPPGRSLATSEQCAIYKWIEGGARR